MGTILCLLGTEVKSRFALSPPTYVSGFNCIGLAWNNHCTIMLIPIRESVLSLCRHGIDTYMVRTYVADFPNCMLKGSVYEQNFNHCTTEVMPINFLSLKGVCIP